MNNPKGNSFVPDRSPGTQGSMEAGRTKQYKGDKSRRIWSVREEDNLSMSLKELVALGWKFDNGFHIGYLNKPEDSLRREFPDTDLKVHPHIVSKLTAWKKNYYSLQGILGRSGVGFNLEGDYMIDCDTDQLEQIVKVDANARYMRNKRWPYWEDWKIIFGKDRANGENAKDILEAVNAIDYEDDLRHSNIVGDYNISLEDVGNNEVIGDSTPKYAEENSICQDDKEDNASKHTRKKRTRSHIRAYE